MVAEYFSCLEEAVKWLNSNVDLEKKGFALKRTPTLGRIQKFLDALSNPEKSAPVIHVTGTNGKGSTVRVLSALLINLGFRVGTFTSPDLGNVTERIALNLANIPDSDFADTLSEIRLLQSFIGIKLSRFELLTALAFMYFANEGTNVNVIEVGLGGTWDATNVVEPEVAIITNVGLDHTEILGPTKVHIANDKSGIFKKGCTALIGDEDPEIVALLEERANDIGASEVLVRDRDFGIVSDLLAVGGHYLELFTKYGSVREMFVPLRGHYQSLNVSMAVAACETFLGSTIDEGILRETVENVTIPGRLDVVGRNPLVVLDGAHNVDGALSLGFALREDFSEPKTVHLVVGMLRGRDPVDILKALNLDGRVRSVHVAKPVSTRAMDTNILISAVREVFDLEPKVYSFPVEAFKGAFSLSNAQDMILVTGSLYVVGDVLKSTKVV